MNQYLNLLTDILENGEQRPDRTGTGTKSVFGRQVRYDLRQGFPLVTTKKCHTNSIFHELLWFLKGDTNIKYLKDNGVKIWDEWADKDGELGPVYGQQWRRWKGDDLYQSRTIDQIANLINDLKNNPASRRHIVSAWNVAQLDKMALAPCHCLIQFYVHDIGTENPGISCQLYQRSADVFLGVPFNIASYALLLTMIGQVTNLEPREFVHTFGDLHLYNNHIEQAKLQLTREPKSLPTLTLNPSVKLIDEFTIDDISLENYQPHPHIKAEVSI